MQRWFKKIKFANPNIYINYINIRVCKFLIFVKIFDFCENRKFEILNPSSNPNFGSLTLNPNSRF